MKSAEVSVKQALSNEAIKAEVWRASSQHESIGPTSLAALTVYFDGDLLCALYGAAWSPDITDPL